MFEFYPAYEEHFAQVQLTLFMLGMGATLTVGDFAKVLRRPRSLGVAMLGQIVFSPLVALAIIYLFGLAGGIALGLILTAAMPGGATAKAFVFLARGSGPLAISLTVASTLAAIVTVPLTLQVCAGAYVPANFEMPMARIVRDVACFVLAPLAAGMYLGALYPRHRKAISRWFIRVGFLVVLAMIICALGSQRIKPGERGLIVPIAIIVFALLCMQVSMLPFRVFGWPRAETVSAGIEVTMRNMNLALLLKASLFPDRGPTDVANIGAEVMFVVLFYAGAAFFLGLPLALNFRRLARRDERRGLPPA
ncbi:MAG: bile acid:sodium symporter [Planctomycetes bacterium]|nr:bile acid:sodium symporter [Planctomycetota bacterium]